MQKKTYPKTNKLTRKTTSNDLISRDKERLHNSKEHTSRRQRLLENSDDISNTHPYQNLNIC